MIRRGQIWWVDAYHHPALVIQRDQVNDSRIDTVVVCVLTSNPHLASAPGNTLLRRRQTGLPKDSVANASQLATVNKADLDRLVRALPDAVMDQVDEGLRWFLALDGP